VSEPHGVDLARSLLRYAQFALAARGVAVLSGLMASLDEGPGLSRIEQVSTPRLKKILAQGEREAARLGHDYTGVEHMFLAMLADGSSVPIQLLGRHLDLDAIRDELASFMESDGYNRQP
jgi:hypothetical protein